MIRPRDSALAFWPPLLLATQPTVDVSEFEHGASTLSEFDVERVAGGSACEPLCLELALR